MSNAPPGNPKRICSRCVGDAYLRKEMARRGEKHTCSYCGGVARTYTIEAMADRIEAAFAQHYERTSDQPTSWQYTMLADKESDYDWERDGEPVVDAITNAAEIPEEAAADIQEILGEKHFDFDAAAMGEEAEFADDSHYEEKAQSDHHWQEAWDHFEHSLKTQTRFFNSDAAQLLASVFDGIAALNTRNGDLPMVDAGPGTAFAALHRARVFQDSNELEAALARPDLNLGSPPSRLASAGRMNARGVSVFYGATSPDVALAEVRPPVGSRVVVGTFDIIRPLRLLNLAALMASCSRRSSPRQASMSSSSTRPQGSRSSTYPKAPKLRSMSATRPTRDGRPTIPSPRRFRRHPRRRPARTGTRGSRSASLRLPPTGAPPSGSCRPP